MRRPLQLLLGALTLVAGTVLATAGLPTAQIEYVAPGAQLEAVVSAAPEPAVASAPVSGVPWRSLLVTYLGLTTIIAVRYLMISGLVYWLLWVRHKPDPDNAASGPLKLMAGEPDRSVVKGEIVYSLLSSFIYSAPAAYVFELWRLGGTAVYLDIALYGWLYVPVSVLVYLALQDTYFYWTHRVMHHRRVFSWMHRVHHRSRPPTPWAAFSFHPYEAVVGAVFLPLLALFVPIHVGAIAFILTLMTVAAVLNHSGYEVLPRSWLRGWLGRVLITAAHHDLHHKHFNTNYALYFRCWDQLCGTDRFEGEYDFLKEPG